MSRPRLTGGHARGRLLDAPVPDGVRPTSSRVREALFSMVGQDLSGVRALDAFGGTGLLALEAWSRGASVTVVDRDPKAIATIRQNALALGAALDLLRADAYTLPSDLTPFDLVLADPPYRDDPERLVCALAPLCADWLVIETDASKEAPSAQGLTLDRRRVYGGTALVLYRRIE